jgi:hypothetical protein
VGDDSAVPQDVFSGFEVGQKLVGVEFDVVDLRSGIVFFDQLADSMSIEFRALI